MSILVAHVAYQPLSSTQLGSRLVIFKETRVRVYGPSYKKGAEIQLNNDPMMNELFRHACPRGFYPQ